MKIFKLVLQEKYFGEYEIKANSKEEAEEKFWDSIPEIDLGSIMGDSLGIEIIECNEVEKNEK